MNNKKLKCFIIGYPIKKPRSVTIWNNYLNKNNIKAKMRSLEIKPKNLSNFFSNIKKDPLFLSTLVTMPHKKNVLKYIDYKHSSVKNTQTANLIYKKNNILRAYNTDVLGAENCLKKELKINNTIIIIGIGGTGEAIFRYFFSKYKNKNFVLISKKFNYTSERVKVYRKLNHNILKKKSIIINATPIGSSLKKDLINKSPISNIMLKHVNKKSFIFDIIYQPNETVLSKLCTLNKIRYLNGLKMNTIQANIGLKKVF